MENTHRQETVIQPTIGWQTLGLRQLWEFRELVLLLTWRDIAVRYKQTVLGILWAILQPTIMMLIFGLVFHRLGKFSSGDLPYPVFVYSGLLPWMFFSTAVSNSAGSVVASERLVTKVYFPRLAIPVAVVTASLVDLAIAYSVLIALMIGYGITPGWSIVFLPVAMGLVLLLALGVGTLMSALNVAYRDFRYVVGFLIQLWMFATPSIYMDYSADTEPQPTEVESRQETAESRLEGMEQLLELNPMTTLVKFFRAATLGRPLPWEQLAVPAVVVVCVALLGLVYFRRVEDSFADII